MLVTDNISRADISDGRHRVRRLTICAAVEQQQMTRGDATMRSRYIVVDVKEVVALGSVYCLTIVADVSWTVRQHLSKLSKVGAELKAVVADSIAVARLENSGMQRGMRMISDIMPTVHSL